MAYTERLLPSDRGTIFRLHERLENSLFQVYGEGNPSIRSVKGLKSQLTEASWAVKRTGNHLGFVIYSYF